ncbi:MAG: quinoprotein relay system zinc metallohydrolase 2 [Gammaproteobacteria bacterium]
MGAGDHIGTAVATLLRACACAFAFAVSAASAGDYALERVAPGVYVHPGRHLGIEDPQRDDIANVGFVVGERCVAVIDSGGSVAAGRRLREAIRGVTGHPVCFVINTHGHFDHVLGNAAFLADRPKFVGHRRLGEVAAANRAFFARDFGTELGELGADAVIAPDVQVDDVLELDLGGRALRLEAVADAHSSQDLVVFDTATGTLWTGDLVFMERLPALDGNLRGWIAVLDRLTKMQAARIVPGHGPANAPWPQAADDTQRYLRALLADCRAAIAAGVFVEDAAERVAVAERSHWQLFDEVHGRNVLRAWKELEWE